MDFNNVRKHVFTKKKKKHVGSIQLSYHGNNKRIHIFPCSDVSF